MRIAHSTAALVECAARIPPYEHSTPRGCPCADTGSNHLLRNRCIMHAAVTSYQRQRFAKPFRIYFNSAFGDDRAVIPAPVGLPDLHHTPIHGCRRPR